MKKESMSMSNYRVAENVTEDKELQEQLRGSIGAWAGEFRDEYADFGRQIEIDKIS